MNPFERHSINHLSCSSLNTFQAEPAIWTLKYLFGVKDAAGPGAWRGSAVEAGLDAWLYRPGDEAAALTKAQERFELDATGESSDTIDKERDAIAPMFKQAQMGSNGWPVPIARQFRVEHWLDDIEIPIIGYLDYVFDDRLVDLKTTHRCPSSVETASVAHIRQAALYSSARGQIAQLFYVTTKKWALYEVPAEMVAKAMADLTRIARALRENLARSDTPEDMARLQAPDFNSFYWNPDTIAAAERVQAWQ